MELSKGSPENEEKIYVCPLCGIEKTSKKQMDFHLKYGHSRYYELVTTETHEVDLEEKLQKLLEEKEELEEEIDVIRSIMQEKKKVE
jgi:hypothetical protein